MATIVLKHITAEEARWIRHALAKPVLRVPDPGDVPGLDRMIRLLFLQFTGSPFRTARFLEAR